MNNYNAHNNHQEQDVVTTFLLLIMVVLSLLFGASLFYALFQFWNAWAMWA